MKQDANKRVLFYILLLIGILICQETAAQTGKLFNADNQLSSNFANQVYQDRDGFIWVATRNGLNQYDGYKFRIFKKEDKEEGMSSNYINCITQSKGGTIFIGNNYTIQDYDGAAFHDYDISGSDGKRVRTYVNAIMQMHNGDMVACTSGFGIVRLNKDHTGSPMNDLTQGLNYIRYMLEDSQGRFWIVTENEGMILVEGRRRTKFFTDENQKAMLREIKQDKNGNIYIAVRGKGIYHYNEGTHSFTFAPSTSGLAINTFTIKNNGELLLGCDGQGLIVYNPSDGSLRRNPFYSRDMDMEKGKVTSIVEDRYGNIWMCLLHKGLFSRDPHNGPQRNLSATMGQAHRCIP